jgi:hypothetical protein
LSNSCKDCQQQIDWNSKAREKLNTRRPLNPDGTIHSCNLGSRSSNRKQVPEANDYPNPITHTENAALDALAKEFQTLVKHTLEYLKSNK